MLDRLRQRWEWVDHAFRAGALYSEHNGGRLAAACAYFGFLAIFPLAFLAFAVLGFVFRGNPTLTEAVSTALAENFPVLAVDDIQAAAGTAGIIGLVGFYFAGLGWVNVLRGSLRTLWRREEDPGNLVVRKAIDAAVLLGLGTVAGLSIALSTVAGMGTLWALDLVGLDESTAGKVTIKVLGTVLALAVNVVLFLAVFTAVPRIRQPFERIVGPAVLCALGLEVLKTIGVLYIGQTQANPAYKAVGVAVGLLVFLYWLHQLLIYGAALTATDSRETVRDLAAGGERLVPADRSQAEPVEGAVPAPASEQPASAASAGLPAPAAGARGGA
jgi:membrane protein